MNAHQRQALANAGFSRTDIESLDSFLADVSVRKHAGYIDLAIVLRKHLPTLASCELAQRWSAQQRHTPSVGRTHARRSAKVLWEQPHPMQKHVLDLDDEALPFSDTELKTMIADGIRDTVRTEINRLNARVD